MSVEEARLSIRIDLPGGVRFGPGMAALLAGVASEGSIASAARAEGMSYARAWRLIEKMNAAFSAPLVETRTGGAGRGGATLTAAGRDALALYRRLADKAANATEPERKALGGL